LWSGNSAEIERATGAVSGSVWSIKLVGLKGEPLGNVTLEFTDENAKTCMSGEWKKTRIINRSFQSPDNKFETKEYYPTYEVNDHVVTIQLNPPDLCDAYIMLDGDFREREGEGRYNVMGLDGVSPLGTFTAKRR
jgi:hypothetical protein